MRVQRLAAVALAVGLASFANAAMINFDSVPSSGNPILTFLATEGFTFTGEHFHTVDNQFFGLVSNGSPIYLASEAEGNLGRPITMMRATGAPFDLTAFDGAEVFWNGNLHHFIKLTGTYALGGAITTMITLDGLGDGAGGIDDFQHFVLGPGWTGLASVKFEGLLIDETSLGGFSLDNIVVDEGVIPEPSTFALLGLGIAVLAGLRRRSR